MCLKQIKPDIVAYNTVLQGLFGARRFSVAQKMNGHVEEALVFLRELERRNVDRSSAMHVIVITGLCKKGKLDIAQDISNKVCSDGLHFTVSEKLHEVFPLLQEMVEKGFSPNAYTFELLINLPSAESTLLDMIHEVKTQRFEVIMF
ncbi:hypothetical protein CQW23_02586 [Capsicum baccatum]|uniref:Pentatricopeptide repeat-containing protein n=1 Tax=Capsicum baccatum TaxID=33114 RepID=A0A2G2XRV5_CAPBA|nr:hypothetical protein CQW23_02586 [Capsicum baccatum]